MVTVHQMVSNDTAKRKGKEAAKPGIQNNGTVE